MSEERNEQVFKGEPLSRFCFSKDGLTFQGDFPTRTRALRAAIETLGQIEDETKVWTAKTGERNNSDSLRYQREWKRRWPDDL